MADSTLDITQAFDRPAKLLKLFDNGDGTYSIAIDGTLNGVATLDALIEDRTQTPTKTQALNVQIGPGDLNKVPVVSDVPHHHLHEGETHQYTYPPTAIAQNGILNFRLVVGNLDSLTNRTPNFTLEIDTTGAAWMTLYETPTTSANGTLATAYNKNRNFTATVPNMAVYTAPTVTAVGTLLSAWMIGSGQKAGGVGRESLEWVLAANTIYLVRVVAQDAQNVCLRMIWYEDLGV